MAREIGLVQIGVGGVGKALAQQVLQHHDMLAQRYGFQLRYATLCDSSGTLSGSPWLDDEAVNAAFAAKDAGKALASQPGGQAGRSWQDSLTQKPTIIVDTSVAAGQHAAFVSALRQGHSIVLANKRPLAENDPQIFEALTQSPALRYEATVGAGLPVISTLQGLLDSGDRVLSIEACMSGTLGYLCTALSEGVSFGEAVRTAKQRGWTETDPRDDLSGMDVARKVLILARTCGLPLTQSAMTPESFIPAYLPEHTLTPDHHLTSLSLDRFMAILDDLNAYMGQRFEEAFNEGRVLRYMATIQPQQGTIEVGLRAVPLDHPMASLKGTDNLFVITTERYHANPLIVRGPGAGVEVTAAGVLSDVIALAQRIATA